MVQAIIMAGGKGSRIRPLTLLRPKPLIPVANRPMIDYIIEKLKINGYNDIVVTLNYLKSQLKTQLQKKHSQLNIKYCVEKEPMGTAGGVRNAKKHLNDTFFVLSGDVMLDINLKKLLEFHQKKNALATILLTPVEDPTHFGIAVLDQENQITKFLEKPEPEEVFSKIANTGTYVLEPEIFDYMDKDESEIDFSKDVFPRLIREKAGIYGFISQCYWNDVGRPETFLKANRDVLNKKILPMPAGKYLKESVGKFGDIWVGKNVQIHDKTRIMGPVVIGDNSIIEKNCILGKNTVIGENVLVEENTTVKGSVILSDTKIRASSHLKDCIVDSECTLDKGCVIEKGVILGNSVEMGPYSLVRSNSSITKKIRILPESIVDSDYLLEAK
jgi:glucose-1-phosphate thymidylyltransferase long form